MTGSRRRDSGPLKLLLLQGALLLALAWPGHWSVDSLVQLYEGRALHFVSFNPPLMSLLLGLFDRLGHASAGFMGLSVGMLVLATAWALGREKLQGWRGGLVVLLALNPVLLVHAGVVWKDVLLGHAVVLAWLWIERMPRAGRTGQWLGVLGVGCLLALMAGVRQQGWLFALPLAVCCAWQVQRKAWGRWLLGGALCLAVLMVQQGAGRFAWSHGGQALPPGHEVGLRILMRFDLAGMVARGGQTTPLMSEAYRQELYGVVPLYNPARVDTLEGPSVQHWTTPLPLLMQIWGDQILLAPEHYLAHRWAVWMHALGGHGVQQCLPYHRGVAGPVVHELAGGDLNRILGLTPQLAPLPQALERALWQLTGTPLWWHWCYGLLLLWMLLRVWRQRDILSVTVLLCTAAFIGSYAVLGIACDFRYGYTLVCVVSLMAIRQLRQGPAGAAAVMGRSAA